MSKTINAKELRLLYDDRMSPTTWTKWIRPLIKKGIIEPYTKKYKPNQVDEIKKLLGEP